jgi:hypothetical protein
VEEQGARHSDKWGGARPAAAQERRKQVGTAIVAREQGRRERGAGAWASIGARMGHPEGIVAFSI